MFNISSRPPMYDQDAVQPMRDELVAVGFEELLTAEAVD
ncbi:MAG: BrxA/BrxB family bacilliredoxin, partial [Ignavibacteriales bacterium]